MVNLPAAHLALTAVHGTVLAPVEKVEPATQAPQPMSALALQTVVMPKPAAHEPQDSHASPLSASLYVAPAVQGAHVRSAVALPATDCPWPAAQVCQAAHPTPAPILKSPLAQAPQEALDAATAVPVPASQFLQAVCAVPS